MQIDARGPRFGAAITLVVLLLVIYFDSPILLAIQTLVLGNWSICWTAQKSIRLHFQDFS